MELLISDVEQRRVLLDELLYFIRMSQTEQEFRLSGIMPSLEQYWGYRMGSSAVGVTLALIE